MLRYHSFMIKKITIALLFFVLLSGCSQAGSADVRSSCSSSGRSGECTITILTMDSDSYRHEISNTNFWPGAENVEVSVSITVEKGEALFWMEDGQGKKQAVTVKPGQVYDVMGKAWLDTINDKRSFYLYFERPGEGEREVVENLVAQVRYDMP